MDVQCGPYLGIAFLKDSNSTSTVYAALLPYWLAFSLFLMISALGVIQRRRICPSEIGVCVRCRYNLTGNTSGICPECGTPVPKEPAEKSPRRE
jgi:hypothetical protein